MSFHVPLSNYFENIALSQAVLISYAVSRLKVRRFICIDLKGRCFFTRCRANCHQTLVAQSFVGRTQKDCERWATNTNLCLVLAALSVIGAHLRTIESSAYINLISVSVPDRSIACLERQRWPTARSQSLLSHLDQLACDC